MSELEHNVELTEEQVEEAFKENVIRFPRYEKLPVDPPLANQNFALFSFKFLPKPVKGVYGFLKFRGSFPTEESWENHAKTIIRTVDSKHKIWPYKFGEWMPITTNEEFASDTLDVTQQEDMKRIYNQQETEEAKIARKDANDIRDRQKQLQDEALRKEVDKSTLDYYAQQVMRNEQVETWLDQVRQRKRQLLAALTATKEEMDRCLSEHPEYAEQVEDHIRAIKEDVGLDPNKSLAETHITQN